MRLSTIDRDIDAAALRAWRESPELLTGELVVAASHTRKDGSTFPVEVRARARLHGGRLVGISICRDVTARVALEAEVEAGHDRVESLLRNLPGIVYRRQIKPFPRLLWIDDRAAAASGIPVADILEGKPRLDDVLSPADLERVGAIMEHAATSGSAYDMTYTMHLPTGARVVHDIGHVSVRGGATVAEGLMIDVTEQTEQERRLRDALLVEHQRYEAVVRATGQVVYEFDFIHRSATHSSSVLDVFGFSNEEYGDRFTSWRDRIHPADRDRVVAASARAIAERGTMDQEYRHIHADGTYRWVWDHGIYRFDDAGNVVAMVGVLQDITARKELEAQLASAQRMETIGALAGGVAHDVNNYLTTIIGNVDIALMRVEDRDLWPELLDARVAADGCARLVQSLLTFARQRDPVRTVLDPGVVLVDSQGLLGRLTGDTVELATEHEVDLPLFSADGVQVQQVLMNLVINARDAMGGAGRITLGATRARRPHRESGVAGEFVRLSVGDTGPGIPPELQQRIFEPYFSTRPFGEGTGLGLSIVHGIARAHGGWAEVESVPGRGATFSVYFPCS
jgi:PAS domain S-box-containing protein